MFKGSCEASFKGSDKDSFEGYYKVITRAAMGLATIRVNSLGLSLVFWLEDVISKQCGVGFRISRQAQLALFKVGEVMCKIYSSGNEVERRPQVKQSAADFICTEKAMKVLRFVLYGLGLGSCSACGHRLGRYGAESTTVS